MSLSYTKPIPASPGVYFFLDNKKNYLYIGKASNLRNRLKSYLSGPKDPRIQAMVAEASVLKWRILDSEIEALIEESVLIKEYRPRFNIMLRDDKQYFFILLTEAELPHISLTHQPQPGQEVIGPFTSGNAIKTTLKLLRTTFPYCTCTQEHTRPCLNAHIGKCFGICCLKKDLVPKYYNASDVSERRKLYRQNIKTLQGIFTGKKQQVLTRLERTMSKEAEGHEFESALQLRTQIERLRQVFENAKVLEKLKAATNESGLSALESLLRITPLTRIEGYDISHLQGTSATGSMVVFSEGIPDKAEYRKFKIKTFTSAHDTGMLKEVLIRRLKHQEWTIPNLILIDGGKGQLNAAREAIALSGYSIPIVSITKNEKHMGDHLYSTQFDGSKKLTEIKKAGASLLLHIDGEAHRFAISYYRRLHRKIVKK